MPENKHARFFITILYIALILFALWFIFTHLLTLVAPFIIAFIVSRIIDYPVNFTQNKLKLPRPIVSFLFTVIFYLVIGTALYFSGSAIVNALSDLVKRFDSFNINSLMAETNEVFDKFLSNLPASVQTFVNQNIGSWIDSLLSALKDLIGPILIAATNLATSVPSILIFVIATIASTYFFSSDYTALKSATAKHIPLKWRVRFNQTKEHISKTLLRYFRALLLLICITFVELSIGLAILGVKNPLLVATVIALIDALPILGTGWVLFPWAIFALFSQNYFLAIGLAVLYAVITVVRNFIEPKIVGEQIGLHPLITLLSIYVGLKLFGIIGMFLPILVALLKKFYEWGYFDSILFRYKTQNKK